jgi:hypothetical protein
MGFTAVVRSEGPRSTKLRLEGLPEGAIATSLVETLVFTKRDSKVLSVR